VSRQQPVVGVSEAITVLFIFISAKVLLTHIILVLHAGMNAAWAIPILDTAVALLGVWLLVSLLDRYSGRDLVQIGEHLTGPYVNLLFSLFYLAVFLGGAGLALRAASERMVAGFLPDTPISVVAFSFLLGSTVVSYLGLEAVTRSARFLAGVLVVSALALAVLTVPMWQLHVFFPLWGAGPWKLLLGALANTGDFVQILLLGLIAPFLPASKIKHVGVWGVVIGGFFIFLFILLPLLIFTFPAASELTLPSFEVARIISIGRFGQRLEIVFMPIWVFGNLIFLAISLYAGAAVLTSLCRLNDVRPFVLAVAALVMTVAFVPQNVAQTTYWSHRYLSQYSFGVLVVVLLFLHAAGAFKKGRGGGKQ